MTVLQAIILGTIQGLAEFLPISSSGHLKIAEYFFNHAEIPILFDILLHLATLAAVCTVFSKKIGHLFCVLGRFFIRKSKVEDVPDLKMILALIIATFMTGIIAISLKDSVKAMSIKIVPMCFIITGVVLIISVYFKPKKNTKNLGIIQAILIGVAQGIGVVPGISRSGSTISVGFFTGLDKETAGEFSFLLSIPAVLAAFMVELKSADNLKASVDALPLIMGMLTAFIVGYFSLKFLLSLIKSGKLTYFAFYLIPLGFGLSAYFFLV